MLNQTMLQSIQIMVPWFVEKITTEFSLDSRSTMPVQMLINAVLQMVQFDDERASYILLGVFVLMLLYYLDKKTNKILLTSVYRILTYCFSGVSWFSAKNGSTITLSYASVFSTYWEQFLFNHQEMFLRAKPNWAFEGNSYRESIDGVSYVNSDGVYLLTGQYHVAVSDKLVFTIDVFCTTATDATTRKVIITFLKGNEKLFIEQCVNQYVRDKKQSKVFRPLQFYIEGNDIANNTTIYTNTVTTYRHQDDVWFGYYHPRKDDLMQWVKTVDTSGPHSDEKYNRYRQPRQFSVICYGTAPGTGKSSLIRKISEYTHRHVVKLNLLGITKLATLRSYFYKGIKMETTTLPPNKVIIELDEFDKVVKQFKLIQNYKKQEETAKWNRFNSAISRRQRMMDLMYSPHDADEGFHKVNTVTAPSDDSAKDKPAGGASAELEPLTDELKKYTNYDWTMDDLLGLMCGSYIPDGRIIIATANDIEIIREMCAPLLRAGRMTPIEYNYGDATMCREILSDFCKESAAFVDVPEDVRFSQAGLIEFLLSQPTEKLTPEYLTQNMERFYIS